MKLFQYPQFLSQDQVDQLINMVTCRQEYENFEPPGWSFSSTVQQAQAHASNNTPGIIMDLTEQLWRCNEMQIPEDDPLYNPLFDTSLNILRRITNLTREEWNGAPITGMQRMRYNVLFPSSVEGHHLPHIDDHNMSLNSMVHNWVGILHLYGDGDTYIFDKKVTDETIDTDVSGCEITTIKFEPGKLTLFDGRYYHTSSSPKNNDWRLVININMT